MNRDQQIFWGCVFLFIASFCLSLAFYMIRDRKGDMATHAQKAVIRVGSLEDWLDLWDIECFRYKEAYRLGATNDYLAAIVQGQQELLKRKPRQKAGKHVG